MHQTQNSRYLIVFRMKNLQDAGIDNVLFWINPIENVHDNFRATSTEEKWRHDVFWSLRSQRRLPGPPLIKQVPHWNGSSPVRIVPISKLSHCRNNMSKPAIAKRRKRPQSSNASNVQPEIKVISNAIIGFYLFYIVLFEKVLSDRILLFYIKV
jgi:hypothetical protein